MCDFNDCEVYGKLPCSGVGGPIFQKPSCYRPLKAQKDAVVNFQCSGLVCVPTNLEIYEWIEKQNYATEQDDTMEHTMFYELDMPKMLENYFRWRIERKKLTIKLT